MKVFMCKRAGGYSGGLAVVAANTEDAFEKVISHIEHAIKEGYLKKEYLNENC